ncbi:MAG TPA: ATP-dependent protease subunit HslV [Spirochaetota bacterium]|nr:ATP-dependent protease subunit HslV [Spirochaetota bacterium]
MQGGRGKMKGTTVLALLRKDGVAMGGDGQVTMENTIMKGNAQKVRRMYEGKVLAGFAGATADAFALFERFEGKLGEYSGDLARAAVELAKEWRLDRVLRRLEALLIIADRESMFLLSGTGDVIKPEEDGLLAIGSGGQYAKAAAKAFLLSGAKMTPKQIVTESMKIAASICIYTNDNIVIEELS